MNPTETNQPASNDVPIGGDGLPLRSFDKTEVFATLIDPLLKQIEDIMKEHGLNGFTMFEVSNNVERRSGGMAGNCWVNNENYQSVQFYLLNTIMRDSKFTERLVAILPMLEMSDGKFLQEMLAPNVPAIQLPKHN